MKYDELDVYTFAFHVSEDVRTAIDALDLSPRVAFTQSAPLDASSHPSREIGNGTWVFLYAPCEIGDDPVLKIFTHPTEGCRIEIHPSGDIEEALPMLSEIKGLASASARFFLLQALGNARLIKMMEREWNEGGHTVFAATSSVFAGATQQYRVGVEQGRERSDGIIRHGI